MVGSIAVVIKDAIIHLGHYADDLLRVKKKMKDLLSALVKFWLCQRRMRKGDEPSFPMSS